MKRLTPPLYITKYYNPRTCSELRLVHNTELDLIIAYKDTANEPTCKFFNFLEKECIMSGNEILCYLSEPYTSIPDFDEYIPI